MPILLNLLKIFFTKGEDKSVGLENRESGRLLLGRSHEASFENKGDKG